MCKYPLAARMIRTIASLSAVVLTAQIIPSNLLAGDLKVLEQMIDTYRTKPVFSAPAKPFEAKACVANKSMMAIPASSSVPFMNEIQSSMQTIAHTVGLNMTEWQNQGQNSQWVQGVNAAINAKNTLIDLCCGLDPTTLAPQLTEAHQAGIKIVASHMTGFGYKLPGYVDAQVPADFYKVGQILAAWALVKANGAPNELLITSDEIVSTTPLVAGFKKTMAEHCPDCKVRSINVPVPDWATRIQTSVQ
jgi:ribose transport system substrate-binding protein